MLLWKLCAAGVALFSVACIPGLLRAALYPSWPRLQGRVATSQRVPHARTSADGATIEDVSYQRIRVEYALAGRIHVDDVPNASGLRDVRVGDPLPIRVCPWRPQAIWFDDGRDGLLTWVLGLLLWSCAVAVPALVAVAIWDGP